MSILPLLLISAAQAESPALDATMAQSAPQATTEQAQDLDVPPARPIYVSGRGSVAVPSGGMGQVPTGGMGVGVEFENGHTFGLRAIYMANPPANPISNSREITQAWGPVLDYQFHLEKNRNLNFYPTLSLGFVYAAEEGQENIILPILEAGFGARLSRKTANGDRIYVAPELGVVPGALAPYTSITVGMIFNPRES